MSDSNMCKNAKQEKSHPRIQELPLRKNFTQEKLIR